MGFRTGAFATVWSVEEGKGKFSKVRLSISRKDRDGQYVQDFSGFCDFIGAAHAKAGKLRERDRIKLGDTDVSSRYDKDQRREFTNFKVFDFEYADGSGSSVSSGAAESNPSEGDVDEDNLPF